VCKGRLARWLARLVYNKDWAWWTHITLTGTHVDKRCESESWRVFGVDPIWTQLPLNFFRGFGGGEAESLIYIKVLLSESPSANSFLRPSDPA
jgi:hypothetical protein